MMAFNRLAISVYKKKKNMGGKKEKKPLILELMPYEKSKGEV
jgi:hypothetical protein